MEDEQEQQGSQEPAGTSEPEAQATEVAKEEAVDSVPMDDFRKVYARAKSAEEELKVLKSKKQDVAPAEDSDIEDRVELRMQNFSRDEIEYMRSFARGSGKKLVDVSKDPFVLAGIEGLRNKAKSDGATPPPSSRPAAVTGTRKDWGSAMSPEERKSAFEAHRQKSLGGKRSYA